MLSRFRSRLYRSLSLALSAVVLAALPLPIAPGVAWAATRSICGSIQGSNGKYVNAFIGLSLKTAEGSTVAGYPSSGYSMTKVINPWLPAAGSTTAVASPGGQPAVKKYCFSFDAPTAARFWMEVYPRKPYGNPERDSLTDFTYFGGAGRSDAPLASSGATVPISLPVPCERGGTTGSLTVSAFNNGQPSTITRILVVSESMPPSGSQGFSIKSNQPPATGLPGESLGTSHVVRGLAPGQRYSVQVTYAPPTASGNGTVRSVFAEVPVHRCATTSIRAYIGAVPAGTPGRFSALSTNVVGGYQPVVGDFTGDGRSDILWYAPGLTADYMWIATGGGKFSSSKYTVNNSYRPAVGDFNGDGIRDIFWFAPGGTQDYLWLFHRGGGYTSLKRAAAGTAATHPYAGDFDRNGVEDILFYDTVAPDSLWLQRTDASYRAVPTSLPAASEIRVGDLDGDFRSDVYLSRVDPSNANYELITQAFSRGDGTFRSVADMTGSAYEPVAGDLNGDFRIDTLLYQAGAGGDYMWRGRSGSNPYWSKEAPQVGVNGTYRMPFVGDFDGNHLQDIFWFQPGTGADSIWLSNSTGWNPQRSVQRLS